MFSYDISLRLTNISDVQTWGEMKKQNPSYLYVNSFFETLSASIQVATFNLVVGKTHYGKKHSIN